MTSVAVKFVTVGKWKENAYLIECGQEAWLVDPGDDFRVLDEAFSLEGKTPLGILNTHGHFDHLGAVQAFKIKYRLPFYIHSKDKQLVRQANLYRRLAGDAAVCPTPTVDAYLDGIAQFELAGKKIYVHPTPGHSQGSVCFEIDNCLFSGDVIFPETLGRTDLPGGNPDAIRQSVNYLLDRFHGYTIYPGHGRPFVLETSVIEKLKALL